MEELREDDRGPIVTAKGGVGGTRYIEDRQFAILTGGTGLFQSRSTMVDLQHAPHDGATRNSKYAGRAFYRSANNTMAQTLDKRCHIPPEMMTWLRRCGKALWCVCWDNEISEASPMIVADLAGFGFMLQIGQPSGWESGIFDKLLLYASSHARQYPSRPRGSI